MQNLVGQTWIFMNDWQRRCWGAAPAELAGNLHSGEQDGVSYEALCYPNHTVRVHAHVCPCVCCVVGTGGKLLVAGPWGSYVFFRCRLWRNQEYCWNLLTEYPGTRKENLFFPKCPSKPASDKVHPHQLGKETY